MKDRIVTYETPDGRSLPWTGILHAAGCRYLEPNAAKPHTGERLATSAQLRTGEPCRVCR